MLMTNSDKTPASAQDISISQILTSTLWAPLLKSGISGSVMATISFRYDRITSPCFGRFNIISVHPGNQVEA